MTRHGLLGTIGFSVLLAGSVAQAQTHVGNVTIDGSLCVGFDCTVGMAFGFDTIVMKENNLRLFFDDTSVAASFPRNDWRLTANDSTNGGGSHFSIEDTTAGRFVFRVFAGARSNALVVDSQGDVGIGTSTPATDIDIKTGNTPTVRLQQDGTSGFTPQTWDMAGNEANFFIRDATSGSTLPFRINPGAPTSAIHVVAGGNIGLGTSSPDGPLHISNDSAYLTLGDKNDNDKWFITHAAGNAGNLEFTNELDASGSYTLAMVMTPTGNMTIAGGLVTGTAGTCTVGTPCDAVFDPSVYEVPSIEEHAAFMWENQYLPAVGPTTPGGQVNVTQKLLRMLNELEHAHVYIEQLNAQLKLQGAEIMALKALVAAR